MSYFDSGVYECPFWQVVLIRVVKTRLEIDMAVLIVDTKAGLFKVESLVDECNTGFWKFW